MKKRTRTTATFSEGKHNSFRGNTVAETFGQNSLFFLYMCVCVSVNKCSHKLSREVCLHRFGRDPNQMVRLCVLCRVPIRRLCTCVSTDEVVLSLWLLHSLFGLKMQPFERGISRRSRWANSLSLWRTSNDRFTPVSSLFFQSAAPWLHGFMYVCVL